MDEETKTKLRLELTDIMQKFADKAAEKHEMGSLYWHGNTASRMADAAINVLVAAEECCAELSESMG